MYRKISIEELAKLLDEVPEDDLPKVLRVIFENPENIGLFGYFFFPHALTKKSPEFHLEIYKEMFMPHDSALAAPRGHAKSTCVGLVFITFCVVNNLEKYIVYVSQNHSKTVQFIEPLRKGFKNNVLLRKVYGDLTPSKARDDDGRDREDCIDINDIRIEAASFEKNIRGFKYGVTRPTLIIGDDIEDDQRVLNPELRRKDHAKLNKVIIPSMDIECGKFKMIGTILHHDSLLIKKIHLYNGRIYKAIYIKNGKETILFPSLFTREKLEAKKRSIGSVAFQSEYLNEPVDNESSLIKEEWIRSCLDEDLSYWEGGKYDYLYQGVDFAFSDRSTADKSAYVSIGNREGVTSIYGLITKKGMSGLQQLDYIKMLQGMHGFNDNALEENSLVSIVKDIDGYGFPYTLFCTSARDGQSSMKSGSNRKVVGKQAMIERLAAFFEEGCASGNLRIPYKTDQDKELSEQLISECTTYALQDGKLIEVGIHGDIPVALALALERANSGTFAFEIMD